MLHVIHLVTSWSTGGVQSEVAQLATGLMARGHKVTIVSLYGRDDAFAAQTRDISMVDLGMTSSRPLSLFRGSRQLRVLLRQLRGDVMHTHAFHANALGRWAGLSVGVPTVSTIHSTKEGGAIHALLSRAMLGLSFETSAISHAVVAAQEAQRAAPSNTLRVIYNGIDTGAYQRNDIARSQLRRSFLGEQEGPLFVSVGRLTPAKNYPFLLEAFAKVQAKLPNAKLAIVGDGPLRSELEQMSNRLGISRSVLLLGTRTDVADILSAADIFLLCSQREGLGLVLAEAMASRLPVVAVDTGGIAEVLGGIWPLLPASDLAGFAEAAVGIGRRTRSDLRPEIDAAEARIKNLFDIEQATDEWVSVYTSALTSRGKTA